MPTIKHTAQMAISDKLTAADMREFLKDLPNGAEIRIRQDPSEVTATWQGERKPMRPQAIRATEARKRAMTREQFDNLGDNTK